MINIEFNRIYEKSELINMVREFSLLNLFYLQFAIIMGSIIVLAFQYRKSIGITITSFSIMILITFLLSMEEVNKANKFDLDKEKAELLFASIDEYENIVFLETRTAKENLKKGYFYTTPDRVEKGNFVSLSED